ncbi:MAG: hypothetical protein ABGZ37_11360, partial [Akkermansiaceae bacterium]
ASRKTLSEKRAKASDAHRKAEEGLRATARALADIESAIKRNDYDYRQQEEAYLKWKSRENASSVENRKRADEYARKKTISDLQREVESLRREVGSLRSQVSSSSKREKKE